MTESEIARIREQLEHSPTSYSVHNIDTRALLAARDAAVKRGDALEQQNRDLHAECKEWEVSDAQQAREIAELRGKLQSAEHTIREYTPRDVAAHYFETKAGGTE